MLLRRAYAILVFTLLLAACGDTVQRPDPYPGFGDGGADAGRDGGADAGRDGGADAGRDGGSDAGSDAGLSVDVSPVTASPNDTGLGVDWYRKGAFMEIYVRGFKDSNGDGIGDFKGVTQSLDYLKDLGITGIWLMPMTKSCDHDHGYAVCDYRTVEPDYGTLADFDQLVTEAHRRGIGVIIDYVMNHGGREGALFQSSARSAVSPYRSWFVWQDVRPVGWTNWGGTNTWSVNPYGPGYYYSVFWDGMPDFNLLNAATLAYHQDNLRFWLNRGVDGFRFDAIEVLIETDKDHWNEQPASYALMKQVRGLLDQYPNRYMVCEAPGQPDTAAGHNSCRGAFAFNLNGTLVQAARGTGLGGVVAGFPAGNPIGTLATMLSNHDSFAGNRPYTALNGNEAQLRLAAASLLTLPGNPFLYYGEEVGMSNSSTYSGDWSLRVPMSWTSNTSNAGFTTGTPFRKPADNVATYNVASEQANPGSLLSFYKRLLNLRKSDPALSLGVYQPLAVNDPNNQVAFLRRYGNLATLVVLNYSSSAASLSLGLGADFANVTFANRYPDNTGTVTADAQGQLAVTVPAQGILLYQGVGGPNEPYLGSVLYVRGEMNGWGTTSPMSLVSANTYQASLSLTASATPYHFKIADDAWSLWNFGVISGDTVSLGQPMPLEQTAWNNGGVGHDLSLTVTQDGVYVFTLDAQDPWNPRMTVTRM